MFRNEKQYLICVTILGTILVAVCTLDLFLNFVIPGLNPGISALFWFSLWRLFRFRGTFSGGIWTFMYLLIIGLNSASAISQIINAIA